MRSCETCFLGVFVVVLVKVIFSLVYDNFIPRPFRSKSTKPIKEIPGLEQNNLIL